jgi:hypothetical protein
MPVSLVYALDNADVERALAYKSEQGEAWEATIPGVLNVNNGAYAASGVDKSC